MACDLRGAGVLVTRPQEQAEALCRLIEQAHGVPVRLPVLAIEGPLHNAALQSLLSRLADFDMAIFVSANAVRHALALLHDWPGSVKVAAVGRATADALRAKHIEPQCCPRERFDSEALLAEPDMQRVRDKKIVIFRGEGGREMLAQTLAQRGAAVQYADVYRRTQSDTDTAPVLAAWDAIKVITATSNDILQQLSDTLGAARLREKPLVVVSERGRALAQEWGIKQVTVADQASNESILQAVCAVCKAQGGRNG